MIFMAEVASRARRTNRCQTFTYLINILANSAPQCINGPDGALWQAFVAFSAATSASDVMRSYMPARESA
jgi:hypothetical protein